MQGLHRPASAAGARRSASTERAAAARAAAAAARPQPSSGQRLGRRREEVLQSLEPWVASELLPAFFPRGAEQWQPSDFLPDPASPDFGPDLLQLREAAGQLPSDLLVAVAGAAAAEAAAPNGLSLLNLAEGAGDQTGAQAHAYARWARAWAAEEARHARALSGWLYLSGRVDSRALQVTSQRLIGGGVGGVGGGGGGGGGAARDPYQAFISWALQERAAKVSHGNAARLAGYHGAAPLARLLAAIASDEARHEGAAAAVAGRLFVEDPEGAVLALSEVAERGVVMPGARMDDGWHGRANTPNGGGGSRSSGSGSGSAGRADGSGSSGGVEGGEESGGGGGGGGTQLYRDYAAVADALGVFTVADYAAGLEQLMAAWNVPKLKVSGAAAAAQARLLALPPAARRMGELQLERRLMDRRRGQGRSASFSWIHKRQVALG